MRHARGERKMMANSGFSVVTREGLVSFSPEGHDAAGVNPPPKVPRSKLKKWRPGLAFGKGWGANFYVGLYTDNPKIRFTAEQIRDFIVDVRHEQLDSVFKERMANASNERQRKALSAERKKFDHGGSVIPQLGYWCKINQQNCKEPSVWIHIDDIGAFEGVDVGSDRMPAGLFVRNMYDLGQMLRNEFLQYAVVLKIDHGGVTEATYLIEYEGS